MLIYVVLSYSESGAKKSIVQVQPIFADGFEMQDSSTDSGI